MTAPESLPPLTPEQQKRPAHFMLRVSLMFMAVFIPNGINLPYFPLWLKAQDFSPEDIGLILSAPIFVRIISATIIPARADRAPDRVPVFLALAFASMVFCSAFLLVSGKYAIMAVSLVLAAVWSPHAMLADSIALSGFRRFKADYAVMRGWGSVAFVGASIAGGYMMAAFGPDIVIWLMVGGFALLTAAVAFLPRLGRPRVAAPAHAFAGMLAFLPDRRFMAFVLACSLVQGSHAQLYAFGSIEWRAAGLTEDMVGWLWAFAVSCEVAMFFVFKRLFGRVSAASALMLGAAMSTLRWLLMPLAAQSGSGALAMFALQGIHAFTFTVTFMGMQRLIGETVPEERLGAAAGLNAFGVGVAIGLLTLVSGPLYQAFAGKSFWFMCTVSLAGLYFAWLGRSQPQRAG